MSIYTALFLSEDPRAVPLLPDAGAFVLVVGFISRTSRIGTSLIFWDEAVLSDDVFEI